jgi:voltage-gated potassium channel
MAVFAIGTFGYYQLTDGRHSVLDCLYATVQTVSIVGFREVIPIRESDALTGFTISLILFGGGTLLYFISSITAMLIEGDLLYRFWRRRMEKTIGSFTGHVVVAGAGRCGMHVINELKKDGVDVVVVDIDPMRVELVLNKFGEDTAHIIGDALEDPVLRSAGLENASGLVAALHDDRDNLFLCLSARQLNPALRIVAKVDEASSAEKFNRVGVDSVVSPAQMGGRRLVNELIRPEVSSFLGILLETTNTTINLVDFPVHHDSELVGKTLREADLRARTNCMVVGLRSPNYTEHLYNPPSQQKIKAGGRLLAMGEPDGLKQLEKMLYGAAGN